MAINFFVAAPIHHSFSDWKYKVWNIKSTERYTPHMLCYWNVVRKVYNANI